MYGPDARDWQKGGVGWESDGGLGGTTPSPPLPPLPPQCSMNFTVIFDCAPPPQHPNMPTHNTLDTQYAQRDMQHP